MPRQAAVSVENNFIRGLITEATGLNFPENACTETFNCVFDEKGFVNRRLGFDYEAGFDQATLSMTQSAVKQYRWNNVAGDGDNIYVVIQIGETLHYYEASGDSALSSNKHAHTTDLSDFYSTGTTSVINTECNFSDGNGLLFVTNPGLESFYVEYDPSANTFSETQIDITVRDFEGDLADSSALTTRPTTTKASMNVSHHYNLLNQGWTDANLTAWDTAQTTMPSNVDVSWYFKDANDDFDFTSVDDVALGNSPAPKGHFILNLYDQDRDTASGLSGTTAFSTGAERVSISTFFAGRVFYSGLNYAGQNAKIFFTQIIEEVTQYGKCYQANDPTAENLFDLLPSDGGVINIQNAGAIIYLFPYLNGLLAFCTNGVWFITGSEGTGFKATDYSVNKISSTPALTESSFVEVEGAPFWWNLNGIYTINLQDNVPRVVSITENTIDHGFYVDIPGQSKQTAVGAYNPDEKRVQWLFRSTIAENFEQRYQYDRVLNFNTLTQAFFPWSLAEDGTVFLNGIVVITGVSGGSEINNVTSASGVNNVQAASGANEVITISASNQSVAGTFKYLVSVVNGSNYDVTFAETFDDTYMDWVSEDGGSDYESYFITGYKVHADGSRKFQSNYIFLFSNNEAPSSYMIRGQWNYSISSNANKWSTTQTFAIPTGSEDNFEVIRRKIKIRGHGFALQYKIVSVSGEPFNIIGWTAYETANQVP